MGPVDRARVILTYLACNEVAGTPNIIHHQLTLYRDADWSVDTTRRRIRDFHEAGFVDYHPDIGMGFYRINDTGTERVEQGISDDDLDDILYTGDYTNS